MKIFVRAQADTDATDAPDATLDMYARAAYDQIKVMVWPWPQNQQTGTLVTVDGTDAYPLANLVNAPDMEFVGDVIGPDGALGYVSPAQIWDRGARGTNSGGANVYTVYNDEIVFYPTPNAAETYTVYGYRRFADWPVGSNDPDLPRGFDAAICWYMLSKYYEAQEDLELAQLYMQNFASSVDTQVAAAMRSSAMTAGPMIFGGPVYARESYANFVRRNTEG